MAYLPVKVMRESDIEKYLVKRVKELGGEVRKVKWVGREGAPDRLVMLPPVVWVEDIDPTSFWIEVKRPGGTAKFPSNAHERKQAREHERMRRMGQRVEVVDSFAGVDALLNSN